MLLALAGLRARASASPACARVRASRYQGRCRTRGTRPSGRASVAAGGGVRGVGCDAAVQALPRRCVDACVWRRERLSGRLAGSCSTGRHPLQSPSPRPCPQFASRLAQATTAASGPAKPPVPLNAPITRVVEAMYLLCQGMLPGIAFVAMLISGVFPERTAFEQVRRACLHVLSASVVLTWVVTCSSPCQPWRVDCGRSTTCVPRTSCASTATSLPLMP